MEARDGDGKTLIDRAAENEEWGLVTTLIDIGAYFEVEARYIYERTMLMCAAQHGNEEVVS